MQCEHLCTSVELQVFTTKSHLAGLWCHRFITKQGAVCWCMGVWPQQDIDDNWPLVTASWILFKIKSRFRHRKKERTKIHVGDSCGLQRSSRYFFTSTISCCGLWRRKALFSITSRGSGNKCQTWRWNAHRILCLTWVAMSGKNPPGWKLELE